jgi:rSAM/selenodomain-associated transferase 1
MTISHLIIFCENPVEGKVKKRLASEVGEENAMVIYEALVKHTADVAKSVMAQRKCYYSEFISNKDDFDDGHFEKSIQKGEDFGERLYNAAKLSFGEWANKVVIIGSDCYDLNAGIIEEAFRALEKNDFVIGPTKEGGFYLLGMNDLSKGILIDKEWNHENVVLDMLLEIKNERKTHYILPTLNEVNSLEEIPEKLKDLLGD